MDREITITVTDEEARRIEERVATGHFESPADYVHADALATAPLDIPDEILERLLEEDNLDSDPGVPAEEAFARVRARIETTYGKG